MATDWEDAKRIAQGAFMNAGRNTALNLYNAAGAFYQDMHTGLGNAYQQILMSGRVYPMQGMGMDNLNIQIAQDAYHEPGVQDWKEYERYSTAWELDNPDPRLTGPDPDAPDME